MKNPQKVQLLHERAGYTFLEEIELPKNAWILSASGLGTPGGYLLVTLNIIADIDVETEIKHFIVIYHNHKQNYFYNTEYITNHYEDLLYINSFDVDDDTYSVFEVLPPEN